MAACIAKVRLGGIDDVGQTVASLGKVGGGGKKKMAESKLNCLRKWLRPRTSHRRYETNIPNIKIRESVDPGAN